MYFNLFFLATLILYNYIIIITWCFAYWQVPRTISVYINPMTSFLSFCRFQSITSHLIQQYPLLSLLLILQRPLSKFHFSSLSLSQPVFFRILFFLYSKSDPRSLTLLIIFSFYSLSICLNFSILFQTHITNVSILSLSLFPIVQASLPYINLLQT